MQPTRLCTCVQTESHPNREGGDTQELNQRVFVCAQGSTPIAKMSYWLIGALELISDDYYRDLPIMEDITILLDITLACDSRLAGP